MKSYFIIKHNYHVLAFSSLGTEFRIVIKIYLITCSIVDLEILVQLKLYLPRHPIYKKGNSNSTFLSSFHFVFLFIQCELLTVIYQHLCKFNSCKNSCKSCKTVFNKQKLTYIKRFRKGPFMVVISMCPWSAQVFITIVSDLQWIVFKLKDKSEMLHNCSLKVYVLFPI